MGRSGAVRWKDLLQALAVRGQGRAQAASSSWRVLMPSPDGGKNPESLMFVIGHQGGNPGPLGQIQDAAWFCEA